MARTAQPRPCSRSSASPEPRGRDRSQDGSPNGYLTDRLSAIASTTPDRLSLTFAALADPTRRAILARLTQGTATVKELSAPFDISGPAISKHLRVLERAGLISRGRKAQWRPCELEASPLKDVAEFAEGFRGFWDSSFAALDTYLETLKTREQQR